MIRALCSPTQLDVINEACIYAHLLSVLPDIAANTCKAILAISMLAVDLSNLRFPKSRLRKTLYQPRSFLDKWISLGCDYSS